jgi:gamma-D-glutamyl-L-lysine dipeptidyl-peptidase
MTNSLAGKNQPEGLAGVCLVSVVPIRKAPREQSEMISQLLFGEYYFVDEISDRWLRISTIFDQYTGWIDRKFFHEADPEEIMGNPTQPVLYARISEIGMPDGSSQLIPAGCTLPYYNEANHEFIIGKQKYKIRSLSGELLLPQNQKIFETALEFMNTPYLWGGRSVFGFDCSGFIQTVFKIHGHSLPKDTNQQILSGRVVHLLKDAVPGDLAFFYNEEGKVNHVGMVCADSQIIHCSGWVRIDRLDGKGILNHERGLYTHSLKEVRRVIS